MGYFPVLSNPAVCAVGHCHWVYEEQEHCCKNGCLLSGGRLLSGLVNNLLTATSVPHSACLLIGWGSDMPINNLLTTENNLLTTY